MIFKYAEFSILGVFSLLLLTKGLNAIIKLSETTALLSSTQKALAESITKLTEQVSGFGYQLAGIEKRIDILQDLITGTHSERR